MFGDPFFDSHQQGEGRCTWGVLLTLFHGNAGSPGVKGAVDGLCLALQALVFEGLARSWHVKDGQ